MSEPAPHLHVVVDRDTGEQVSTEQCPGCRVRDEEITGLETEKRSWRSKFYAATADRERKAREHEAWPTALRLFKLWQRLCNHGGVGWTAEHFWAIEPHLRDPTLGEWWCRRAIEGAGFDPFINPKARKNGTKKRHDDWTLVFRDADKVRDFAARAPVDHLSELLLEPASLPNHERNLAAYMPDGATPWDGPLPSDWATA